MYFPLLRARQFELIGLRTLLEEVCLDYVWPIIEPVSEKTNNILTALRTFEDKKSKTFIILNSKLGGLKQKPEHWVDQFSINDFEYVLPAFRTYESDNIDNFITKNSLINCLIIHDSDSTMNDEEFIRLARNKNVKYLVIEDIDRNRTLKRQLASLGKDIVRLDDLFTKEARNSDYLSLPERKFTEEHEWFKKDGFFGFCDYTVLDSTFVMGGGPASAVVINITYIKDENNSNPVYIRHFTSETNDSPQNIQGKFAEAAKKACEFIDTRHSRNIALNELKHYYNSEHYPGLGTVKKISIMNHLIIVQDYLKSNNA